MALLEYEYFLSIPSREFECYLWQWRRIRQVLHVHRTVAVVYMENKLLSNLLLSLAVFINTNSLPELLPDLARGLCGCFWHDTLMNINRATMTSAKAGELIGISRGWRNLESIYKLYSIWWIIRITKVFGGLWNFVVRTYFYELCSKGGGNVIIKILF